MKNHTQKKPPRSVQMSQIKRGIAGSNKTVRVEDNPDLGLTPNAAAPQTAAEKNAVKCFKALEAAEHTFTEGIEFGKAMIALRDEIKGSHRVGWMDRVKQLGITYEKVRYWVAVVEGKPTQRSRAAKAAKAVKTLKPKTNGQDLASDWDVRRATNWETVMTQLQTALDGIEKLMRNEPIKDKRELKEIVDALADLLGYRLVEKAAENAA